MVSFRDVVQKQVTEFKHRRNWVKCHDLIAQEVGLHGAIVLWDLKKTYAFMEL